jgi:hypothetical protein
LLRFAGQGQWGQRTTGRAESLAAAGLGSSVRGTAEGFLLLEWVPGRPTTQHETKHPAFVAAVTRYLAPRSTLFASGRFVAVEPLLAMVRENATDALGPNAGGLDSALRRIEQLPQREAVVPDARMQAREWVTVERGAAICGRSPGMPGEREYVKVDALDHGDGLRLPGPVDRAWDIAGAAVEYALHPADLARLSEACARAAGESVAELAEAVAAYRVPYAACCLGQATLADRST